ncbi:MAG: hypothetical protein LC772_01845, partial [Chloroflexi bacterium]|nr:hypothetical protein [Chloroflexota bacterium]
MNDPRALLLLGRVMLLLGALMGCPGLAAAVAPGISPRPPGVNGRAVIVITADRLLPGDIQRWASEPLRRALSDAEVGVISSRAASYEGDAGGYGSIGAGAGTAAPDLAMPSDPAQMPDYAAAMQSTSQAAHTAA